MMKDDVKFIAQSNRPLPCPMSCPDDGRKSVISGVVMLSICETFYAYEHDDDGVGGGDRDTNRG